MAKLSAKNVEAKFLGTIEVNCPPCFSFAISEVKPESHAIGNIIAAWRDRNVSTEQFKIGKTYTIYVQPGEKTIDKWDASPAKE